MSANEIKALQARENALRVQLSEVCDLLEKAKLEACPVKVGDIVIHERSGLPHRVTEVDVRWGSRDPWLYGNPKKKDGTWGTARRALYSYWKKAE